MRIGSRALFALVWLAGAAASAEPAERHEDAGREVLKPPARCRALAASVRSRCRAKPDAAGDATFLKEAIREYEGAGCAKIWDDAESLRIPFARTADDDGTKLARLVDEQLRRLTRELADGMAGEPRRRGQVIYDEEPRRSAGRPFGAGIEPSAFTAGSPERAVAEALARWPDARRFSVSAETVAAFEKVSLPLLHTAFPLENLCLAVVPRDAAYFRNPKATLASLFAGAYLLKAARSARPGEFESFPKDLLDPKALGGVAPLLRYVAEHDPAGFHRQELRQRVVDPFFLGQLARHLSGDYVGADTLALPFQQFPEYVSGVVRDLSPRLLQRLAHAVKAPALAAEAPERAKGLLSARLSSGQTIQVVLPGRCETGDKGSFLPAIGRFDKKGAFRNLAELDPKWDKEWYYDVVDAEGKTEKKLNGLYDRKSFVHDEATGTTRINVKIPQNEFETLRGDVHYYVRVKCDHRVLTYKATVSLERAKEAEAVVKAIRPMKSPPYAEADKDGVRKILFVSGAHTRPASNTATLLKDHGAKCTEEDVADLKAEFFRQMKMKGKDKVDFFIKDAHANGDSHEAGVFDIDASGKKFTCRRKVKDSEGREIEAVIVVLGAAKHAAEDEHTASARVEYDAFFDAIRGRAPDEAFHMASLSCWSVGKCAYELAEAQDPRLQFVTATCRACTYYSHANYPENDAHHAVLLALVDRLSYGEMEKKYPVFKAEGILMPHQPDFVDRMGDAVRIHMNRNPARLELAKEELDEAGKSRLKRLAGLTDREIAKASTETLEEILGSALDGAIKGRALQALAQRHDDPGATVALLGQIARGEPEIRDRAAYLVGKKGGPEAVAGLLSLLRTEFPAGTAGGERQRDTVRLALHTLQQLGPAARPILSELPAVAAQGWFAADIVRVIRAAGVDPVAIVEAALKKDKPAGAAALVSALGKAGKPLWPQLIRIMESDDKEGRAAAAFTLESLARDKSTAREMAALVPDLVRALGRARDDYTKHELRAALAVLGPVAKAAIPALRDMVKRNDSWARLDYAHALGSVASEGDAETLKLFQADLASKDPVRRFAALNGLAAMGPGAAPFAPEAVRWWIKEVEKEHGRRLASLFAGVAGGPGAPFNLIAYELASDDSDLSAATRLVAAMGKPAATELAKAAREAREPLRSRIVILAGHLGADAAPLAPFLADVLDKDPPHRAEALRVIDRLGTAAAPALPALLKMVGSDDVDGRALATTLSRLGPPALPALRRIFSDEKAGAPARIAAAEALVASGDAKAAAALDYLLAQARESKGGDLPDFLPPPRLGIRVGGDLPPPDDLPGEGNQSDDNAGPQAQAARAIGRLGPKAKAAVPHLIEAAGSPDGAAAEQALVLLGKDALPALVKALSSSAPGRRAAVARVLGKLEPAPKEALPQLEALALHDPDPQVRTAALWGAKRVQGIGDPEEQRLLDPRPPGVPQNLPPPPE